MLRTDVLCTLSNVIESKKIKQLKILDVKEMTTLTDVFVVVTVPNTKMSKALADDIELKLQQEYGLSPIQKEGYTSATWILIDYPGIMIHILDQETAEFYNLDRLWRDAPTVQI